MSGVARVASPCVGVCTLRPGADLCAGCLRTVREIGEWRDADDRRRREILDAVAARRAAAEASPAGPSPAAPSPG